MKLTFFGAAQTVTGSKYMIEVNNKKLLVDCGLFQGRKELRLRNWEEPPFDSQSIDAVILTHAHIDHIGYLPVIVSRGFNGPIYCSAATQDLVKLLLLDAASIQEEEAYYATIHGTSKHHPAKPLFTREDAMNVLPLLRTFTRNSQFEIAKGITARATCAGHILGSVCLNIDAQNKRITFSGDIGRFDTPILPNPEPLEIGNLLLCESTYGDRLHADADTKEELASAVNTAVTRRGALVIPAFAVGRTQTLLYYLAELEREERIPVIPVYVDSPMAVDATDIYRKHKHDYDEESLSMLKRGDLLLRTKKTVFCSTTAESKRINFTEGARIIISASGMVTGGRVLHHLMHLLPHENTTILFVGYQAEGTRGRLIQSGANEIKIFGRYIPIRAHVISISGLSAHGDRDELLRWLKSCKGTPNKVKIIHGEQEASESFSRALTHTFKWNSSVAKHAEEVEL